MAVALTMCTDVYTAVTTHRPSGVKAEGRVRFSAMTGDLTETIPAFARMKNVDVVIPGMVLLRPEAKQANWRAIMTRFLDLSIHDLVIMVGLGCFTGSAMAVAWSMFSAAPTPKEFALSAALLGFVLGKLVSDRSGEHPHA